MLLIGLVIVSVLAGLAVGIKTDPFNFFGAMGIWSTCAVLSVVILGITSWHSQEYRTTYKVDKVIVLERGVAVGIEEGPGIYIRNSVTRHTDNCDTPYLRQIKHKTYPHTTIVPLTTRTTYILCIPDPLAP